MEFKGTKNRWTKSQLGNGDIQINASGFRNLAIVNFYPDGFREKYINGRITGSPAPDSSQYRRECLYNALLISKAPEMLEMLNEVLTSEYVTGRVLKEQVKKLIKEATELK